MTENPNLVAGDADGTPLDDVDHLVNGRVPGEGSGLWTENEDGAVEPTDDQPLHIEEADITNGGPNTFGSESTFKSGTDHDGSDARNIGEVERSQATFERDGKGYAVEHVDTIEHVGPLDETIEIDPNVVSRVILRGMILRDGENEPVKARIVVNGEDHDDQDYVRRNIINGTRDEDEDAWEVHWPIGTPGHTPAGEITFNLTQVPLRTGSHRPSFKTDFTPATDGATGTEIGQYYGAVETPIQYDDIDGVRLFTDDVGEEHRYQLYVLEERWE